MQKNILITTPIYYVNDKPHIGHLYTSLLADACTRYHILFQGRNVRMISGVDEHGIKVQRSAEQRGKNPMELCNEMSAFFRELLHDFNVISSCNSFCLDNFNCLINPLKSNPDDLNFIRTTEGRDLNTGKINTDLQKGHIAFVCKVWRRLLDNGWIYLAKYTGFYSVKDESFYKEEELVDGRAPTGSEVFYKEEECYFFKLSALKDVMSEYLEHAKLCKNLIVPSERVQELIQLCKDHFYDLPVSRYVDRDGRLSFYWGIPVPDNENHVIYVWLDALFNYMSALGVSDLDSAVEQWKNTDVFHFIGKEISKFHAIYWPAFLIGLNVKVEKLGDKSFDDFKSLFFKKLFIHGWWTNCGKKISKSDGNMINPYEEIDWIIVNSGATRDIAVDYLRFYLLCSFSTSKDADYSRSHLVDFVNANIVKNIGNLTQRTIALYLKLNKLTNLSDLKQYIVKDTLSCVLNFHNLNNNVYVEGKILNFDFLHVARLIFEIGNFLNKFIDSEKPWLLISEDKMRATQCVVTTLFSIIEIARLISAICPSVSEKMLSAFNLKLSDIGLKSVEELDFSISEIEGMLFCRINSTLD